MQSVLIFGLISEESDAEKSETNEEPEVKVEKKVVEEEEKKKVEKKKKTEVKIGWLSCEIHHFRLNS